jgi:hypothetical protein
MTRQARRPPPTLRQTADDVAGTWYIMLDGRAFFVAGYTAGGAPYGMFEDEMEPGDPYLDGRPQRHAPLVGAGSMDSARLKRRVIRAAEDALAEQQYVSLIDIVCRLGWIHPVNVEAWRRARLTDLESLLPVPAERMVHAGEQLAEWARERSLAPVEVDYVAATRDRRRLTFLAGGTAEAERPFRTHWFSPSSAHARFTERESKARDLVVFMPRREWRCATCDASGDFLFMDGSDAVCLDCADLGQLLFLPSGDAALTRRAKKASRLCAVVVRWAAARKRYERQGILVEEDALEQAEEQCLADAEARQRRQDRDRERRARLDVAFQASLTSEIRRLFPGCPPDRAEAIARHTAGRGTGRVGRSAPGQMLDERATTLAVVASVRHVDTGYDEILMSGTPRAEARSLVSADVDRILDSWRRVDVLDPEVR